MHAALTHVPLTHPEQRSQFLLACEALELWMQQFRDASAPLPEHFPRIAHTLIRLLIQENAYDFSDLPSRQ